MQKLVYISNSRDYTEQKGVNENKYLLHINDIVGKRLDSSANESAGCRR